MARDGGHVVPARVATSVGITGRPLMSAVLFGSISTIADTSELQRRAFNEAFASHGLDWEWSRDDYVSMLGSNGGAQRVADFASGRGEDVDAKAVHAT